MKKIFYTNNELESLANSINRRYFPKRLIEPISLDHYLLLEKLGLDIEWKYISPNSQILGMIFLTMVIGTFGHQVNIKFSIQGGKKNE